MDVRAATMVNKESLYLVVYRKMGLFISSFWFCIANSLVFLVGFVTRYVFGIKKDCSRIGQSVSMEKKDSRSPEPVLELSKLGETKYDAFREEETPSFSFKFQYQIPENSADISGEPPRVDAVEEKAPATNSEIRKYRFLSEKHFSGFVEKLESMTYCVRESYLDQSPKNSIDEIEPYSKLETEVLSEALSPRDFEKTSKKDVRRKVLRSCHSDSFVAPQEQPKISVTSERKFSKKERLIGADAEALSPRDFEKTSKKDVRRKVLRSCHSDSFVAPQEQPKNSVTSERKFSKKERLIGAETEALSPRDLEKTSKKDVRRKVLRSYHSDSFVAQEQPKNSVTSEKKLSKKERLIGAEIEALSPRDFKKTSKKDVRRKVLRSYHSDSFVAPQEQPKNSVTSVRKFSKNERLIGAETELFSLKDEAEAIKFGSSEFSGFDSDSESSWSDGYSVKNLIVDSDSDGFLSEGDFGEDEHQSYTSEASTIMSTNRYKVKLLEESHLQSLYSSDAESLDSRSMYTKNQIDYESIFNDFLPESGFAEKIQSKNIKQSKHREMKDEKIFQKSSSFDAGFIGHESSSSCSSFEKSVDETSHHDDVLSEDDSSEPISELNERDAESGEASSNIESNTEDRFSLNSDIILSPKSSNKIKLTSDNLEEELRGLDSQCVNLEGFDQVDEPLVSKESDESEHKPLEVEGEKKKSSKGLQKFEKNDVEEGLYDDLEDEEEDELESLWEHQELIEQLKNELKKVKAIGLPTILEECESPKTMEDLKPWKIEEKFLREDPMDEMQKFYKSYRERMRKLDILNYQKMYAIGFLQLKDPLQSMGAQKPLIPTITSLVIQNFLPFCRRKTDVDPSECFIRELHNDLEAIYVGQTCLSWEFLRWQYEKARELPESDPYRGRQYNQVAGEFQQFQVLLQRFIENESFQGPRMPNYVKNRCVLRNLLQVPVIKEDGLKDRIEEQKKGQSAITSEMLEDIMEDCINVLWEFVKADKDETPVLLKSLMANQVELQDPSDHALLVDAQAILQKKDKRLKDLLKTGNCLVKKFKKPQEDRSNQDQFFSLVDLRLVARVLSMSRLTTDQLAWCHKKLTNITFLDRKLHREPSFLIFPC